VGKVQIKQCVCWKARRHPVADWLYIWAFQMTVTEIIISPLSIICVRRAFVCDIVRSLGATMNE